MPCRLQLCGITDQPDAGKVFNWHGIYERRFLQSVISFCLMRTL